MAAATIWRAAPWGALRTLMCSSLHTSSTASSSWAGKDCITTGPRNLPGVCVLFLVGGNSGGNNGEETWEIPVKSTRRKTFYFKDELLWRMDQRDAWDRFYAQEGNRPRHFDWFFGYKDISGLLLSVLQELPPGPAQVLDVGCGTSALGLGLYRDAPRPLHISCLDFSPPALDSLRRLLLESPPPRHPLSRLHCHLADATDLDRTFEPGSFHLVLDKGTCDSLLRCPQGPGRARKLVAGCLQVLRPEGSLLQFSDEDPDVRLPFLEQAGRAKVTVREIGHRNGICYYVYMVGQGVVN